MKLGRVIFDLGYVVDLENQEMVDHAKDCIYEDIMSAIKYNEVHNYLEVVEAPDASEGDIPEFLIEDHMEDWVGEDDDSDDDVFEDIEGE
jgi:hypothetical protein